MHPRRRHSGTVVGAVLGLLLSSAALGGSAAERTLRFRQAFDPSTLDWTMGDVPILVVQNVMRGLYKVSPSGAPVPDLASRTESREGGKHWIFTLAPGVKWSDGVPLQASHVRDAWLRLLDPSTGSVYSNILGSLPGIRAQGAITVPSPLKIEVRLSGAVPFLPAVLTHWVTYPVRLDLIQKHRDYGHNPAHMAFLGPYGVSEWKAGVRIALDALPGQDVATPRIEALIVSDDQTALRLYESGKLDWMTDPGELHADDPQVLTFETPILTFLAVGLGQGAANHPLLTSDEGRRKLFSAIDRSEIPKMLGAPHRIATALCAPPYCAKRKSPGLAPEARPSGEPTRYPPLTLRYFKRPAVETLAVWLQAQFKKNLGLEVKLEGQDVKSYWEDLKRRPGELFLNSRGLTYPHPDAYYSLFASGNPQSFIAFASPNYDAWVMQAAQQASRSKRDALYEKADRLLIDQEARVLPLYFRTSLYLVKPHLRGLKINPLTGVDLSVIHRAE